MTLSIDPRTTAAVFIDMQEAVLSHPAEPVDAPTVFSRAAELAQSVREAGALNIFVRTSFLPNEQDAPNPLRDFQKPKKPRPERWDQLVETMARTQNEPVVVKRTFNAFHGSDLDHQLRSHGIDTILLAGISTNLGVEGTGRSAYDLGYNVVFVEGIMATAKAANHEYSVNEVFPYLGRVRPMAEVFEALSASA
ncbi:isochorismatase family protein [Nesterenkonia alkaliphila]|uniref:Isochorismatase family protein n=1 Tax=Nesterenkonia alkaliphila TaxID=1463631 RepID=A0A7K1UMM4_9MICC|nr:isochorismatase family protein [Nesterenkonia alkaliphila]MVT27720.1 isochorismatase family protein [Nesterenkonia alkaliphila]GFZ87679.1 hydrolase [Nesterenkonia alkaliphila]